MRRGPEHSFPRRPGKVRGRLVTRIALFVLAVAGLVYLLLEVGLGVWLGLELERGIAISVSVIAGILAWTGFLWWGADRLGRKDDLWHDADDG